LTGNGFAHDTGHCRRTAEKGQQMTDSDGAVILQFPFKEGMRPPAPTPSAAEPAEEPEPARKRRPPAERESACERLERQARASEAKAARKQAEPRQPPPPPRRPASLDNTQPLALRMPNRHTKKYPAMVTKEALVCVVHEGSFIVDGRNPGSDQEPRWVTYLDKNEYVTVQTVHSRIFTVRSTVLREGPERDRLYAVLLADWPGVARYEERTGLLLPIVRLDPLDDDTDPVG
jgi:hypothetical protein